MKKKDEIKVCLVGSSGGHLTHLYMLKPFWKDKNRFWVTFDKEDARSLLEGEKVYPCYFPTNRSIKALIKNTKIAWDVLHKEKPDLIISCGAAVAVPFFYIGKMMGAKLVYIEVFDRIDKPTMTGKMVYPAHPIGVYFETENIYTLNPSSQYSLDVQALLADWESGNKSRRMILSYDQRIMTGQYPVTDLMGYRHTKDGQLVIEPEEAKTVRFIFLAFIYGYNYDQIAAVLTQKKRSTLRGRQEWNGVMVANIMKNERRWGDLEARKSIVVDYKLGKVTKNNGNRCSAYVPEHHEAIVSPEIARAAHLVASSSKKCGVQDIVVIRQGALKGFVGIHPNWNGINAESIRSLCLNAYLSEEVGELNKIWMFLNSIMVTITLKKK